MVFWGENKECYHEKILPFLAGTIVLASGMNGQNALATTTRDSGEQSYSPAQIIDLFLNVQESLTGEKVPMNCGAILKAKQYWGVQTRQMGAQIQQAASDPMITTSIAGQMRSNLLRDGDRATIALPASPADAAAFLGDTAHLFRSASTLTDVVFKPFEDYVGGCPNDNQFQAAMPPVNASVAMVGRARKP